MRPWLIVAALLLAALTGMQGYRMGAAANEAVHVARLAADRQHALEAAAALATAETKRLAAEQSARLLAQALEDQAYADPVESLACLPRARVLRLNKR